MSLASSPLVHGCPSANLYSVQAQQSRAVHFVSMDVDSMKVCVLQPMAS